jgi:type I restriction enzyme, R subunit
VDLFESRGVDFRGDDEPCLQLLGDARLRAEFTVKLKQFLELLELVLPRPEALPYVKDAKRLGFLHGRARIRYRDGKPSLGKEVGAKVRKLIDDHLVSLGVDPKVPPISITHARFAAHVEKQVSPRAKASEMEHAIRYHIREHMEEDPVHYQKLSERLEEILRAHGEGWEQLTLALKAFLPEVEGGRQRDESGLDPGTEAPFFAVLKEEREKEGPVGEEEVRKLRELTVRLVALLREELKLVGFWKNPQRQAEVRGKVFMLLDEAEVVDFDRVDAVADRVMELARHNHGRLVGE